MANDFLSFNLQLDDFARKVGIAAGTVQKRVAFDLFGRIVRRTPVDTGRARASWNISINQPDRSVVGEIKTTIKPGEKVTKRRLHQIVKAAITSLQQQNLRALQMRAGDTIWISNNLPYIVKLEEGHSRQSPPHAMVGLSIEEVNVAMSQLIGEGLKDAGL